MKKKRKVSQDSVYQVKKKMVAEERGDLSRDKQPWTNSETDTLLDGFLAGWYYTHPDPSKVTFQNQLKRSEKSIETRLWKVATRYKEASEYIPSKRTTRHLCAFTHRDYYLIEKAVSKTGRKNNAHLPSHIAMLLGKGEEQITQWMNEMVQRRPTLLTIAEPGEIRTARLLSRMLEDYRELSVVISLTEKE